MEESVGRNISAMKLFTIIIPRFRHYIITAYEISQQYYEDEKEELAGIGQENKFSRDMHRDVTCIIICQIEKKLLEIFFRDKITRKTSQCVAIAFVDNTDFM